MLVFYIKSSSNPGSGPTFCLLSHNRFEGAGVLNHFTVEKNTLGCSNTISLIKTPQYMTLKIVK